MSRLALQIASTRILTLLRHKGVVEGDRVNADESLADSELAELAVASGLGRVSAGPALRQQDPIRLSKGRELEYPKGLCAAAHGFSLHAATTARADDAVCCEALCKYILRPPIARENILLVAGDLVRLRYPKHSLHRPQPGTLLRPSVAGELLSKSEVLRGDGTACCEDSAEEPDQ